MSGTSTVNKDMGTGSVRSWMVQLALPAVVAQIINLLYNIVDRIYIGHLPEVGATALTGVGLCMPILILLNAFAMLCGSGSAPAQPLQWASKIITRPNALWATAWQPCWAWPWF